MIVFIICLCIISISVPIVFVKKYINTNIIGRIPKSRITPAPNRNTSEQAIEMNSIHGPPSMNDFESTGRINMEEFFQEIVSGQPSQPQVQPTRTFTLPLNVSKYNENLISFSGIFILGAFLLLMSGIAFGSRFGWISLNQSIYYWYINFCCLPVILPTIYFGRKPNHLVVVMKDLNLLLNTTL